jgi:hypothetical protein
MIREAFPSSGLMHPYPVSHPKGRRHAAQRRKWHRHAYADSPESKRRLPENFHNGFWQFAGNGYMLFQVNNQ